MRVPILRRTSSHPGLSPAIRRVGAVWASVLLATLLGGAVAGCTGTAPSAAGWTQDPAAAAASVSTGGMTMSGPMGGMHTADQAATAWSARPDFVKTADARTVEAYAYALARGDALEWMPCYCGCVAMEHRHNLDCFFKPHAAGTVPQFEEHASYCKVCVDIALRAKGMQAEGKSLTEIRAAVDAEFGANAPGTKTGLPPAGT